MLQVRLFDKYIATIIVFFSIVLTTSYFVVHRFFSNKLNNKMQSLQQEQQISIEQLNNKLNNHISGET